MRRLFPVLLAALLGLAACATPTPYRPAAERGQEGYTETRLTPNRFRISFIGNTVTPADTVQDYALLRAAELTLQEGHDWFRLVDRSTDKKVRSTGGMDTAIVVPGPTRVYRSCGLLGCDTVVASSPGYVAGVGGGSGSSVERYTASLEILLGKNPAPKDDPAVYDARALATTLRHSLKLSP